MVDNHSSDGSREMIKKEFLQVKLMENLENVGFGKANNQAAKEAAGKMLLFLNSDTQVFDQAIDRLYHFAFQKKNVICGGRLINPDGSFQASCGPFYTLPYVFLWLFLQGDRLHLTRSSPGKVTETDWVSGACLLLRNDDFKSLSGFDESIFMYMDEVDLCYRARSRGLRVIFYPEACFLHVGSASSADKRTPYINVFKGLAFFYKKHWPSHLKLLLTLLKIKANLGIGFGVISGKTSFVTNYRKALEVIRPYE